MIDDTRRGMVLAATFSLLIIGMDALVKHAAALYPVAMVVWARYTFHLASTPLFGMRGGLGALVRTRQLGLQILRSVCMLGATAFFFSSLALIPLADAIAIGFVGPFIVVALARPILGERAGADIWIACAVGFVGALIIIRPGFADRHWAYLLPLGASLSGSLYGILTRRLGSAERPTTSLFYMALVGAVASSLVVPFFWQSPDALGWLTLGAIGLSAAGAHLILIQAYRLAPASVIAPLHYLDIVWGSVLGLVVFDDFPDTLTWVGIAVIVASGLYVFQRQAAGRRQG